MHPVQNPQINDVTDVERYKILFQF